MPEKIAESVNRIQEAFKRMPRADAEIAANEAAARAEAIADYAEMIGRAVRSSGSGERKEENRPA